jgi:hypothetical protein
MALVTIESAPAQTEYTTVSDAMDDIVTRLYATYSEGELANLDAAAIEAFITPEERAALATKHWYFDVDAPVIVSVLRESQQATVPFWLTEAGFAKTEMTVTNVQDWTYEVWQKVFPAGRVELGINGFDKHRPHYLVSVGPQNPGETVTIANLYPEKFSVETTAPGATCYHDWSELVLKTVPEALVGQHLLTTIRGRARDAHLIAGFRQTPYPSSPKPDQVMLTWSDDPKTTQTVQWRTNTAVRDGVVLWREVNGEATGKVDASVARLQDRMLANDRYVHRHTAVIQGLTPGTDYAYVVGSPSMNIWSQEYNFTTAPATADGPVTFFFTGDTHQKESWGAMMDSALKRHAKPAFYNIAGDLVDTGQYLSDWNEFFHHGRNLLAEVPLMPSLGNHDAIDGLGPGVYLSLFDLPKDGPEALEPEQAHAFEYGNVLMINLDCTAVIEDQDAWLERVLRDSKAEWKFASYHFPNFDPRYKEDYQSITDHWSSLLEKYGVDMVFQGHTHRYFRTKPIRAEQPVESPADGVIYVCTIAIPNKPGRTAEAPYIAKAFSGVPLYQTVTIKGKRLVYEARDAGGVLHDSLTIEK